MIVIFAKVWYNNLRHKSACLRNYPRFTGMAFFRPSENIVSCNPFAFGKSAAERRPPVGDDLWYNNLRPNPLVYGFIPVSRGWRFFARLRTLYHAILLPLAKARHIAAPLSGRDLPGHDL